MDATPDFAHLPQTTRSIPHLPYTPLWGLECSIPLLRSVRSGSAPNAAYPLTQHAHPDATQLQLQVRNPDLDLDVADAVKLVCPSHSDAGSPNASWLAYRHFLPPPNIAEVLVFQVAKTWSSTRMSSMQVREQLQVLVGAFQMQRRRCGRCRRRAKNGNRLDLRPIHPDWLAAGTDNLFGGEDNTTV
ncbi:hypothetical protein PSPO01_09713 [Paraphaeosphaeria sporulosa]